MNTVLSFEFLLKSIYSIVCRLFIGVGEALFGQAVALYYSYWYKKDEVGKVRTLLRII